MALDIQDKSLEKGSTNFSFLKSYDPIFIDLASSAERAFISDPNATLIKLRQLAKAFRGELTQEWRVANPELISGDNSAEALLKRIKAEREKLKLVKNIKAKKTSAKKEKAC